MKGMLREHDVSNSRSDPIAQQAARQVHSEERKKVGDALRQTNMGVLGVAKQGDLVAARRSVGLSAARKRPRGPAVLGL